MVVWDLGRCRLRFKEAWPFGLTFAEGAEGACLGCSSVEAEDDFLLNKCIMTSSFFFVGSNFRNSREIVFALLSSSLYRIVPEVFFVIFVVCRLHCLWDQWNKWNTSAFKHRLLLLMRFGAESWNLFSHSQASKEDEEAASIASPPPKISPLFLQWKSSEVLLLLSSLGFVRIVMAPAAMNTFREFREKS